MRMRHYARLRDSDAPARAIRDMLELYADMRSDITPRVTRAARFCRDERHDSA